MYLRHDLRAFNLVTLTRGSRGYRKKPRIKQTQQLRDIYMYRIYKGMIYAIVEYIYMEWIIAEALYSVRSGTCYSFYAYGTLYNSKCGSGTPYSKEIYI